MVSTSFNSRWSTCVFACWLSCLLRAGLTISLKRCCTISRTSFASSAPARRSFIIFSKSARGFHTLPPAKLLRQLMKTPLGLRLISACFRLLMSYYQTPCPLTSHCLSQLGTSQDFPSVQSILPTPLGSVRVSRHLLFTFSLLMVARGLSNQLDLGTPE